MEVLLSCAILFHFLCVLPCPCHAEIKTIGNPPVPGQSLQAQSPSMWVDLATRIPPSVAIRWRLYSSVGHRPVRLQIWRPLVENDRFTLVAEHRVVPTSIGLHEYDLPVGERVTLKETDKLGFTNEMPEGPVAYSDATWRDAADADGAGVGVMWAEVSMMPQVGTIYKMSHLEPERRFSLNLDVVTCREAWVIVDKHCVQFLPSPANWLQARDHCQHVGGHLVTPKSWAFASSLRQAMILQGMAQTWLGLSYNDTTAYFTWMDEEGGDIYSMHQTNHGDFLSNKLCVALTQLGHWSTVNCSQRTPFICQNNLGNIAGRLPLLEVTTTDILPSPDTGQPGNHTTPSPEEGNSSAKPTASDHKVDCDEVPTWSQDQNCLQDTYKLLLGQALQENRSLGVDIRLMEIVRLKRQKHSVTMLDLILLNGVLDAILEDNIFQGEHTEETKTHTFIKSLADATGSVLGSSCNCSDAWRNMTKLEESPVYMVRRLEGVLHKVLRHMTTANQDASIYATNNALVIHMETMEKESLVNYEHHTKEEGFDITIPKDFFNNSTEQIGVSTVVFKQANRLISPAPKKMSGNATLNSKIVSVTIHPPPDATNAVWLAITVPHLQPVNRTYQATTCVFWDYRSEEWSTDGCRVAKFLENSTVCEFNHLTNFAVLMQSFDFRMKAVDRQVLSVVTYVGCFLSIFGLLATVLTHLVCRCFSERGRILINLCLALLLAYILFIFGIDRTNSKRVCRVVAVGLHYFYLSAFFWMLAQGIELYSKLRIVFMQRSKIIHYTILGWGLPALIVAVALAMRFDDYGQDEYCWLSMQTGLVWSFIGPVVIVVLANFCVLCFVLNTFNQPRLGKESGVNKTKSKSRRSAARAALILLPVLGLTWILGLLSVNEHTIVFQYLFAACNSSQGFLIFILHCVLNEEVRSSWRRHVTRRRTDSFRSDVKSVSTTTTGLSRRLTSEGATWGVVPKTALRPSSSASSSITVTSNQTVCAQSSIISERSTDSGSHIWVNRKDRVRMLGLGYLLPGRSKRVVITDPKAAKRRLKTLREAEAQGPKH